MNIFVGKLDPTITPDDLRLAFAGYGTIVDAIVIQDTSTGAPLGYGHVYLVPDDAARQAIQDLNQVTMRGQNLTVRECLYRKRRERRLNTLPWNGVERRDPQNRRTSNHAQAEAPHLSPARG